MSDVDFGSLGLDELAAVAADCTLCPLAGGRTHVVFGTGDPDADLMFVGKGPGAEEDKQGEPFVGPLEPGGLVARRGAALLNAPA